MVFRTVSPLCTSSFSTCRRGSSSVTTIRRRLQPLLPWILVLISNCRFLLNGGGSVGAEPSAENDELPFPPVVAPGEVVSVPVPVSVDTLLVSIGACGEGGP